MSYNVNGYN